MLSLDHHYKKYWRIDGTPILFCEDCGSKKELSVEEWREFHAMGEYY